MRYTIDAAGPQDGQVSFVALPARGGDAVRGSMTSLTGHRLEGVFMAAMLAVDGNPGKSEIVIESRDAELLRMSSTRSRFERRLAETGASAAQMKQLWALRERFSRSLLHRNGDVSIFGPDDRLQYDVPARARAERAAQISSEILGLAPKPPELVEVRARVPAIHAAPAQSAIESALRSAGIPAEVGISSDADPSPGAPNP